MSRGIETTIDGKNYTLDVEHVQPTSVLLSKVCQTNIHTGCGSQGSCGTCMVLVKGRPRMSCTMRAKNIHNKKVNTLEGIPKDFLGRLEDFFVQMGAVQCGLCLPAITIQLYNLLKHIPIPTEEDLRKVLSMHSCRCMAPNILIEATKAFIESSSTGDGWVHKSHRLSISGQKPVLMHFHPKGLRIARPIIGQSVTLPEGLCHESVEFIWRKDHIDSEIFIKAPFLLGFIVTTEEWVLDSTEKQLTITPLSKPNLESLPANVDLFLPPTDLAPLETEVCTIIEDTIHINGTERLPDTVLMEGYNLRQWSSGGSFGHRQWFHHIEWALWVHQHLKVPVSIRPTMAQMLVIRPKRPLVSFKTSKQIDSIVLSLHIEDASNLHPWQSDLSTYLGKLRQSLPAEIKIKPTLTCSVKSNIPQQYSYSRILQVGACLLSLIHRHTEWDRSRWAEQIVKTWELHPNWLMDVRAHATLIKQAPNRNLGWGLCVTPPHKSRLTEPLTCSIYIESIESIIIKSGIPESDGFLASTLIQILHSSTRLPLENLQYQISGLHPDPDKDCDTIRLHCIHAIEQCAEQLNQILTTHDLVDLVGQHFSYSHRELVVPGNGCSVVTELDEKGDVLESWIALNIGNNPSHSNVRSELSGRWMRSLNREKIFDRHDSLSSLYKDIRTLKAKQAPKLHWSLNDDTQQQTPWSVIDGATIASVADALYLHKRLIVPHPPNVKK